jgi:hypothetical protein
VTMAMKSCLAMLRLVSPGAIEPATQPPGGHDQPESAVDTGTVSIVSMIEMVSSSNPRALTSALPANPGLSTGCSYIRALGIVSEVCGMATTDRQGYRPSGRSA